MPKFLDLDNQTQVELKTKILEGVGPSNRVLIANEVGILADNYIKLKKFVQSLNLEGVTFE